MAIWTWLAESRSWLRYVVMALVTIAAALLVGSLVLSAIYESSKPGERMAMAYVAYVWAIPAALITVPVILKVVFRVRGLRGWLEGLTAVIVVAVGIVLVLEVISRLLILLASSR